MSNDTPAAQTFSDTTTYKQLRVIEIALQRITWAEEALAEARENLANTRDDARQAIKAALGAIADEGLELPGRIDLFGTELIIAEEWYDHVDILDAVKIEKHQAIPSIIDLCNAELSKNASENETIQRVLEAA